ncbi:MAG: outer membrane lipid asymmetry maintenance protein MlaD, partial [Geminicoccaceae bacterium]
ASQLGDESGYELIARFDRVDGLQLGDDVRIGGIKVGTVVAQNLDPATYRAEVRFTVREDIELPTDSSVSVAMDGLLGGKYLSLIPGGDVEMLADGDEVTLTQSAINLEDLIGHLIFGQGSDDGAAGPDAGAQGSSAEP